MQRCKCGTYGQNRFARYHLDCIRSLNGTRFCGLGIYSSAPGRHSVRYFRPVGSREGGGREAQERDGHQNRLAKSSLGDVIIASLRRHPNLAGQEWRRSQATR